MDGAFGEVLRSTHEAIVLPPWVALAVCPRPSVWEYLRVNVHVTRGAGGGSSGLKHGRN